MTMHRMKTLLPGVALVVGSLLGIASLAQADEKLNQILKVGQDKNVAAAKSQVKVDKLAD